MTRHKRLADIIVQEYRQGYVLTSFPGPKSGRIVVLPNISEEDRRKLSGIIREACGVINEDFPLSKYPEMLKRDFQYFLSNLKVEPDYLILRDFENFKKAEILSLEEASPKTWVSKYVKAKSKENIDSY